MPSAPAPAPAPPPLVMGKLQGPRANPSSVGASAGYMTITKNAYYKWIFYATAGDELAFGIVPGDATAGSLAVSKLWRTVAAERGLLDRPKPNRYLSWLWTDITEETADAIGARASVLGVDTVVALTSWHVAGDELVISPAAFPSGVNATVSKLQSKYNVKMGLHLHPDIAWPCEGSTNLKCLTSGVGVSKIATEHADALVADVLAPTYRSGNALAAGESWNGIAAGITEDLGFYWMHDPLYWPGASSAVTAHNGNPKPCGQGSCVSVDWSNNAWAPNMTLHGTSWSKLGLYRGGYALGFDGEKSYGVLPNWPDLDATRSQITIGVVLHTGANSGDDRGDGDGAGAGAVPDANSQTICNRPGVWRLSLEQGKVQFSVNTTKGIAVAVGSTVLAPTQDNAWVVRATYNSTSGSARVFVGGNGNAPKADGVSSASFPGAKMVVFTEATTTDGAKDGIWVGADLETTGTTTADAARSQYPDAVTPTSLYRGAMEELYFKNASAEHRTAYLYSDNNRFSGSYLIDLTTAAGRDLFASAINSVLDQVSV